MAKLKMKDIRNLSKIERDKKLSDLHEEYLLLQSKSSMGGTLDNPSRIREIRRTIARIKTVINEEKKGIQVIKE
jgi:large subunit ribosomal protein L29